MGVCGGSYVLGLIVHCRRLLRLAGHSGLAVPLVMLAHPAQTCRVCCWWEQVWRPRGGGSFRSLPPTVQTGPPVLAPPSLHLGSWLTVAGVEGCTLPPSLTSCPNPSSLGGAPVLGVPLGQGGGWQRWWASLRSRPGLHPRFMQNKL